VTMRRDDHFENFLTAVDRDGALAETRTRA
jgi:hypothetical protein